MDRTENTSPNSSIVASCSCRTDRLENATSKLVHWYVLGIYCLAKVLFTKLLLSNGSTCYNIIITNRIWNKVKCCDVFKVNASDIQFEKEIFVSLIEFVSLYTLPVPTEKCIQR
jgi:hypothetical protein